MFVFKWLQQHKLIAGAVTLVCSAGGLGLYIWFSTPNKPTRPRKGSLDDLLKDRTVSLRSAEEFLNMWITTFRQDPASALFPVNTALESFSANRKVEQKQLCAGILAVCSFKLGEYDQAKSFARMWYKCYKETQKFEEDGAEILCILGEVLNRASRFSEAERFLLHAQAMSHRARDVYALRNVISQLTSSQRYLGSFEKCISNCEDCLKIAEAGSLLRGQILRTLGAALSETKKHARAIQVLKESIEILKSAEPAYLHARAVGDLGVAYARRNHGEDALMAKQLLQRAEADCTEKGDLVGAGTYIVEIAKLSLKKNDYNDSLTKLHAVLAIADNHGQKRLEAQALLVMAETKLAMGDRHDVATHIEGVMSIAKKSGSRQFFDQAQRLNERLASDSGLVSSISGSAK